MTDDYRTLEATHSKAKGMHDLSETWATKCNPLSEVRAADVGRLADFCNRKRIEVEDLYALGAKFRHMGPGPDFYLAFPGYGRINGERKVTAIKYRNIASSERKAEAGSTFGEILVIGDQNSKEWFWAEGETDAARLHNLVGRVAAIAVLPAGALTLHPSWVSVVPRGATNYLAHDADDPGDAGASKASRLLGGGVRVRPPGDGTDWCDWDGTTDEFVAIVQAARAKTSTRLKTMTELIAQYKEERSGEREPVRLGWGTIDAETRGVSDGQVLGVAARTAVGKTWALGSIVQNIALPGHGVGVCTLEMPGVEWAERQLAMYHDIAPEEVEKWAKGDRELHPNKFFASFQNVLVCEEGLQIHELPFVVREMRERMTAELRCIVIDYLGLLGGPGKDTYERVSLIGKGLKMFAKEERLAVVVALQLSRAAGDGSTEVTLEMLRDSGVLEESLDFLLGCWRPGKARGISEFDQRELADVMKVAILKNRKGQEGRIVDLMFREKSRRVYEPSAA